MGCLGFLADQAKKENMVKEELMDYQVLLEPKVIEGWEDFLGFLVSKELKVKRALLDSLVQQDMLETKVIKDKRVWQDCQELVTKVTEDYLDNLDYQ